jgi:hypothetical protein
MYREGEAKPIEASLHGDDGRLAGLVESISDAAEPPAGAAAAFPGATGEAATRAPAAAERSVLYALHLASYRSEASAAAGWRIIAAEAAPSLDGLRPRLETVDLGPDRGVYLRLKAGPVDSSAQAAALCAALIESGHYCKTADFEGHELAG